MPKHGPNRYMAMQESGMGSLSTWNIFTTIIYVSTTYLLKHRLHVSTQH